MAIKARKRISSVLGRAFGGPAVSAAVIPMGSVQETVEVNPIDMPDEPVHLGDMDSADLGPALRTRLRMGPEWTLRRAAARALVETTDCPETRDALAEALTDEMPDVRWAAAESLAKLGDQRATLFYADYITSLDEAERWAAVWGLGRAVNNGDLRAVQLLRPALDDHDPLVREAAEQNLRHLSGAAA